MSTISVIGAGLSGLSTAWYLAEAGARVHVVEASPKPGGLIQTSRVPDGLVEAAARAFTWSHRTATLFTALDLPPCFAREESRRRYVYRGGRARRWPLTPLESARTAARFGAAFAMRHTQPRPDETVAAWGARVVGPAATEWLIAPALQGIYASPPEALSAVAIFGKKRQRRARLAAPPEGMGELIARLHHALEMKGVTFEFGKRMTDVDPSVPTAICTAAPAAAQLLRQSAPTLADAIGRIRMTSLVAVTAFFDPHPRDLRGFGILFPRGSGIEALGAMFNADMFPGRSALRSETWIYGGDWPHVLANHDGVAVAAVIADRHVFTGRADLPRSSSVTSQASSLPIYDAAVLDAQAALHALPRHIVLAGNYLGRLGVSHLLDGAADAAAHLTGERVAA
jgi:protoporphyrinogen/coproporphyrinogen III oxidase